MKTVLVTGSSGFTGHFVCRAFAEQGYQVVQHAFQQTAEGDYVCDLTDEEAVVKMIESVKPDGIIHLAALSFVGHQDQSALYKVNVFGILNLFAAIEQAGITPDKIIVASSANVYGNPAIEAIDEMTVPEPVNHYAASKLAMEFMVKTWFQRLPIIITRPFNYTGVGQDQKFLVPKIVSHFRQGKEEIELGNLDVARDFSDVRDIARAYLKLYESGHRSEIVNLCSGKVFSLQQTIELLERRAGYKIRVHVNPAFIRDNEIKILKGKNDKLKKMIDYLPEYGFMDTLNSMYNA